MTKTTHQGTALITGASTGIGATYAARLAWRGYDLVLTARDEARLQALAAQLRAETGVQVDVLKADLGTRDGRALVEARLRDDAAINLLLNNAGMAVNGALAEADTDKLEAMVELNVIAVVRLAAAAARSFSARGRGTIINVASVLALTPEIFNGAYSGTKAFVLNLTLSMQNELAGKGIRVQAVLPGATRTEVWERAGSSTDALPAGMLMEVNEMVDAALAGFDQGEQVTIPSLPDTADFTAYTAARHALGPNLSRNQAAARYKNAVS